MHRHTRPGCYGVGVLALGLWLLAPMTASAVQISIFEDASLPGSPTIASDTSTGPTFRVFQTHPTPSVAEQVGFHGEWNTTDASFAGLLPGQSYSLSFHFCELTNTCSGPFANPNTTNEFNVFSDSFPGVDLTTFFPTPLNSDGTFAHGWFSDFHIRLFDLGLNDPETPGEPPLFGYADLSDTLNLTFSRAAGPGGDVSVDGDFQSNPVPEPASLLLFGSGLAFAGLKLRRSKSAS